MIKGADISTLAETEALGLSKYIKGDLLQILKAAGFDSVRLRLWNNPYDDGGKPFGAGTCDLDTVMRLAARAQKMGMSLLIDFQYSDFWADPSKQTLPRQWSGLSFDGLVNSVSDFTKKTLSHLRDNGITADYIQIGNEITNGMLWDYGKIDREDSQTLTQSFDRLSLLLKAGISSAKEIYENARIMLHLERSYDNAVYREWFDNITVRNVDFDIIGVSYYPYWHHGLDELKANLDDMAARYQKDIVIAETSYVYTLDNFDGSMRPDDYVGLVINNKTPKEMLAFAPTEDGQCAFIKDLAATVRSVYGGRGKGFYYWEPAWLPLKGSTWASKEARKYISETHKGDGNEWANQTLFNYKGKPLKALSIIKDL